MIPRETEFKDILLKLGRSKNTIKSYVKDLEILFRDGEEISNTSVQDSVLFMSGKGNKPSTIRRFLSSVKTYCGIFGIQLNFKVISKPKIIQRESSFITDDVFSLGIGMIIADVNTTDRDIKFKCLLFDFLYKTGIRISELLSLTTNEYNREYNYIQIIGKGNKQRRIPIHKSISHVFDLDWFFERLQRASYSTILYWTKKHFGKQYSPHSFRHGYTTKLIKNGASERAVQSVLGHESYVTTLRYFHMNHEEIQAEVISAMEDDNV